MTRKIKVADLPEFDISEHLDSEEAIAAYLTAVIEESDPSELAHALGVVARARGMTQVARDAGLTREALYKALRPGAQPRFDTVQRVCTALGVKLSVTAAYATPTPFSPTTASTTDVLTHVADAKR
jgi:probable addiction module antidote protein